MLERKFKVIKVLEKELLLLNLDDQKELLWPREYLPKSVDEGHILSLSVSLEPELLERKRKAQDLLNEILQINE